MEVMNVICDICNQEVANSEELKAHMEREHPAEESEDEGEMPEAAEG